MHFQGLPLQGHLLTSVVSPSSPSTARVAPGWSKRAELRPGAAFWSFVGCALAGAAWSCSGEARRSRVLRRAEILRSRKEKRGGGRVSLHDLDPNKKYLREYMDGMGTGGRNLRGKLLRPETAICEAHEEAWRLATKTIPSPQIVAGMEELAEMYDAFSLDQYGVLHDGRTAYPGVAECLEKLHAAGKPCVILSNYAGRAASQRAKLPEIGINPDHLAGIVTSGELTFRYLSTNQGKVGSKALWIAWAEREKRGQADFWDELEGYSLAKDVEEADFILVSGVESLFAGTENEKGTTYEQDGEPKPFGLTFRKAIARNLPMLCANPDLRVVRPGGWQAYLGGSLAAYYEKIGGRVIYFGKPYTSAFEEVHRIVAEALPDRDPDDVRVCHVGDSLTHDVQGAHSVCLDAAFVVKTGLHAEDLEEVTVEAVEELCVQEKVPNPATVLERFQW